MPESFPRIASLKTAAAFREHLRRSNISLDFDDDLLPPGETPLARPFELDGVRVGNRFCVLPMEGWDGTPDGKPSELTIRRWRNFGLGGAKLFWGGEAVAVRHDGRANPNQLLLTEANHQAIAGLRDTLISTHREKFGSNADSDVFLGLQLTHSGRWSRPNVFDQPEPLAAVHHPVLDRRVPAGVPVLSDDDLDRLVEDFVVAARLAASAGYQFIDVKACHGYLGHELLGARARQGRYGGPALENRMRFMRNVIEAVRAAVPRLLIAVRVSVFDLVPYRKREDGIGEPDPGAAAVNHGFGLTHGDQASIDDGVELLIALEQMHVKWICITGGSPYYNPHTQRPALFPPLDGYLPPEDPLRGVARHRPVEGAIPEPGPGGIRLQLSAGVAAARRTARGAEWPDRLRRPWTDRAVVPGPAGRRAERDEAAEEVDLPHVQRLHDGPAAGDGLRLLSARPVLHGEAGGGDYSEEAAQG
jgi:2,4-dienoyl-CoA reductase-like NADH-dependent reductase (Old Yellow Enzyme family)